MRDTRKIRYLKRKLREAQVELRTASGAAVVYIYRRVDHGWEISADPEHIFVELFDVPMSASSEANALRKARKVRDTMIRNMSSGYGHPDDSEILINPVVPPVSYERQPPVTSVAAQQAGSDALYSAHKELGLGLDRPLSGKIPSVEVDVVLDLVMEHLMSKFHHGSLSRDDYYAAALWVFDELTGWEKVD